MVGSEYGAGCFVHHLSDPVGPGRGGMGDAIVVAHEPDLGPSNLPQKCELGLRCDFGR